MSKRRIYISGAIIGLPFDEVQTKFAAAEEKMSAEGYEAVNPLKTGIPYNFPWESRIAMDIVLLIGCEAVYLLSDWNLSKSATLEKNIAELTGKQIIYETIPVFVELKQAVYEFMEISFYEIASKVSKRNIVYARMIYSHYCIEQGATITETAKEIKKNHSTVIYYLRKFKEDKKHNKNFREIINRIETALSCTETGQISTQI